VETQTIVTYESKTPRAPVDVSKAQSLKPVNIPEAFLREYEKVYDKLSQHRDLGHQDVKKEVLAGIPPFFVSRWLLEKEINRSTLALLAAAFSIGWKPSIENLSTYKEFVAGARQARKLEHKRRPKQRTISIVGENQDTGGQSQKAPAPSSREKRVRLVRFVY